MKLPSMRFADGIGKSKQIKFGGLNHSVGAGDGELWDMRNMTSDHYPVLATRERRWKYRTLQTPGGLFSWEGLCWVDGMSFYYRGERKGAVSEGRKTFASMGAYILIFPDKMYYNVDTGAFGSMESVWEGQSLTFCDGLLYGEEAQANCIRCDDVDWATYFQTGDAVTISGCTTNTENNKSIIIRAIDGGKLYFYEHSFTLGADGAGYTENGEMCVKRTVPDLKYLCENENRMGRRFLRSDSRWMIQAMTGTVFASRIWRTYRNIDRGWALAATLIPNPMVLKYLRGMIPLRSSSPMQRKERPG